VVAVYKAMIKAGHTKEEAVQAAQDITRSTQNPSSDLQASPLYISIKDSGYGFLFPFLGQPMVSRNMLLRDYYFLHHEIKTGNKAGIRKARVKLAASILGLIGNITMRVAVLRVMSKLSWRDDDDDEEKQAIKNLLYSIGIAANDIMDLIIPGAGRLADVVIGAIGGRQPRDMSIYGGVLRNFNRAIQNLTNPYDKDDVFDEEKLRLGIFNLIEMSAALAGGPVGGPLQVGRVAKNLLSE